MFTSASDPSPSTSLLGDYFAFLKHPTDDSRPGTPKEVFLQIWRLYTVHVLLIIPMAIGIQLISKWMISIEENKLGDLLESIPTYKFLFLAVLFAPLAEEILFRLPLRFSRVNLLIPIALILLPLSSHIIQRLDHRLPPSFLVWSIIGAFLYALWALSLGRINQRTGEQFFARHLTKLVYGSSIVFALLHIMNYPQQAWLAAPILVLPQATLGLLLAYVRIKFGFWWSVFTHGLHNFLASTPILFIALGSGQLRQYVFEKNTEVELLPWDYVLQLFLLIWVIGLSLQVFRTAFRLIQEWRQAKPQGRGV